MDIFSYINPYSLLLMSTPVREAFFAAYGCCKKTSPLPTAATVPTPDKTKTIHVRPFKGRHDSETRDL